MIKDGIVIIKKKGINYLFLDGGQENPQPWIGDFFSSLYDGIMKKSVFPKKFNASMDKHYEFLAHELGGFHKKRVLELATGSGSIANILSNDNSYYGIDISKGLLKIALKKFKKAGFREAEFYLTNAEFLPFIDKVFDLCICNLSLNFFSDLEMVLLEMRRVLKKGGIFFASVPVPERNETGSRIIGNLYSEEELHDLFIKNGFIFTAYKYENGTLLYFRAVLPVLQAALNNTVK